MIYTAFCAITGTEGGKGVFPEERITLTRLDYVILHRGDGEKHDYSGQLTACELIYKLSGTTSVHFAGETFAEQTGDIRFLPKTEKRVDYFVEPIENGDSLYFRFDYDGVMPKGALMFRPRAADPYRVLFEKMYSVWIMKEQGYYQKALSLAYAIIALIQKEQSESYLSSGQRMILSRSMDYLRAHAFEADFDYALLAEAGGTSYSYYKRLFGRYYGMPPSKYLTSLRMHRACELLESGLLSVSQTAESVGYTDAAYFCRVFRREMGEPPATWRRRRRA
jgi:AraC-like DNA-binding protein